jgi:hypothetical protein
MPSSWQTRQHHCCKCVYIYIYIYIYILLLSTSQGTKGLRKLIFNYPWSRASRHTHTHSVCHTRTHTHNVCHTRTHTHSVCVSLSFTHTHTHTHTVCHTRTHTHSVCVSLFHTPTHTLYVSLSLTQTRGIFDSYDREARTPHKPLLCIRTQQKGWIQLESNPRSHE